MFRVGIGTIEKDNPSLFSLLSVMSPFMYQWEEGSPVPVSERVAALDPTLGTLYEASLQTSIGGLSLVNWLAINTDPVSLYMNLNQFPLTDMPLLQFYTVDQIRLLMRARCYSWIQKFGYVNYETVKTLFTVYDEEVVKNNAYGKYASKN